MKQRNFLLQQLVVGICAAMAGNAWSAEVGQDAAQTMKEVVVTSSTIDDRFDSKRDEPSSTSVISGGKVDDAHAKDITQILNSVPGVTAEVQSGDSVKIMLRGIENQRYMGEKPGVAVVIDGVPVFERTGRVNIDLDNIESIRVIKGGASYLFGEDALSGAVIITTKRGAKYAGATVAAEAGSFGFAKRMVRVGGAGENGSAHIQYTDKGADDYYYQGIHGSTYLSGNAQLYLSDTSDITFGFEKSDRNKDSHGTVNGVTQAATDPRSITGTDYSRKYEVALEKVNLTYSNNYSKSGNLLAMVYQYKDHTKFWTKAITPEVYTYDNDQNQIQRGFKGEWRDTVKSVGLLGGVDIRANNYKSLVITKATGATYSNGDTDEDMKAVYGEVRFDPAKDWTLTFNGRHDNVALDYKNILNSTSNSKSFGANSWRAGANYDLSPSMGLYSNISTGFRLPTADQLFVTTASAFSGYTIANPDLNPEQAVNKEIGWRAKTAWLGVDFDVDVALFQIDRKDYIMATNGQYASAPSANDQTWDNIGGVRNRGLELALRSDPKRPVSLNVAYTHIDARFTKYDNYYQTLGDPTKTLQCPLISPTTKYCQTNYNLAGYRVPRVAENQLNTTLNWQPTSAFRLGLEADTRSWSYADEINQEKLPGRTLFNLMANYDVKEKGFMSAKWSLFARIDNLLDRDYWVTARASGNDSKNTGAYDGKYNGEDLSIVVGRGRVWTAGLSATF